LSKIVETKVNLEPFQADFFKSTERFPAMIAGWATGKTMCALQKGIMLSEFYNNNLGCIIRSKFTDLRDSTMKDFTRYTGIHVPQGTKEAKIGNSTILFRHAKELSGLQNVNLGWFYIEQAEEFPTDTQFTLLRGRLRRELTINPNYEINPRKAFYPLLCSLRDTVDGLRQGMVIANSHGHNWCWKKWIKSPQKGYSCIEATTFDNIDNLPADFIADLKVMEGDSPGKFQQYVMNCHDEIDLDACYYATALSDLRKTGQIGNVAHDPAYRVYLATDIGLDCTAIWLFQVIGQKILFIDYYENTGKFTDHYAGILDEKKKENGYNYGRFIMPHDANKREQTSGTTFSRSFKDLGYNVITLPRELNIDFGINNVNNTLKSCWFDERKCELGLDALNHYRREYNEEMRIYLEKPLHDWASHPADSIRYACKAISEGLCGRVESTSMADIHKWQKKYRRTG